MDQKMCRLCNENIGVTSLFGKADDETQLSARVIYCVNIKIAEDDGLPTYICACCEDKLASTYSFIIKCEEIDKKLRSMRVTPKQECESKYYEVKIEEEVDDSLSFDNTPEESYESLNDIKKEWNSDSMIQTKRKYVKQSKKRKSKRNFGPSKCNVCERICNNPSTLAIHMRSHTNEKPHACLSCDKKYKDIGSLKRHTERNHCDSVRERRFVCEQCGKAFFSKNDCKIHMRIHTGELPYACTKCPKRFTQLGTLQRHLLRHTGERSHSCTTCSKKFSTKEQLQKHYLVHTTEKKFQCPICDLPFKYSNNLKKHIKMHTQAVNKFICNYCSRGYSLKGNLKIHISRQHSSKSGFCVECVKHVPDFETHMWKHTGERPVKCELCPSSFYDLKGLTHHINFRHKYTDKYKCTINDCTFKFPSRPMLDYHIARYHKSVKPFSCDKCPRDFYRKSDLARHTKGTHKEKLV